MFKILFVFFFNLLNITLVFKLLLKIMKQA